MTDTMDTRIDQAQALLGMELASYRWVIEEGHVRQFRHALESTGAPFITADGVPITFTVTTGLWGHSHQSLLERVGLDPRHVVHGEQCFELLRPLEVGAEYTVTQRLSDVAVKSGRRGGRMLIVVVETRVADEADKTCAIEWHTSIQTEGA